MKQRVGKILKTAFWAIALALSLKACAPLDMTEGLARPAAAATQLECKVVDPTVEYLSMRINGLDR